jgi:hypothetical protein
MHIQEGHALILVVGQYPYSGKGKIALTMVFIVQYRAFPQLRVCKTKPHLYLYPAVVCVCVCVFISVIPAVLLAEAGQSEIAILFKTMHLVRVDLRGHTLQRGKRRKWKWGLGDDYRMFRAGVLIQAAAGASGPGVPLGRRPAPSW